MSVRPSYHLLSNRFQQLFPKYICTWLIKPSLKILSCILWHYSMSKNHWKWACSSTLDRTGVETDEVRWVKAVQNSNDDRLSASYFVHSHPDSVNNLHSWAREWSWWAQFTLAHLPDQGKIEVMVLEARPNLESLGFCGFNWVSYSLHMTELWLKRGSLSLCAVSKQSQGSWICHLGWEINDFRSPSVSDCFTNLGAPCRNLFTGVYWFSAWGDFDVGLTGALQHRIDAIITAPIHSPARTVLMDF